MNIEKEFDTRFKKLLTDTLFEGELTPDWKAAAFDSLRLTSILALGITAEEFKQLYTDLVDLNDLNCFQVALLNNLVESRSSADLNVGLKSYIELMISISGVAVSWTNQTKEMKDNLLSQLADEQKALSKAASKPNLKKA